jgi:hypothetical protein
MLVRNASIGSRRLMSIYRWQGRVKTEETDGRTIRLKVFASEGTVMGRWDWMAKRQRA